MAEDKLARLEAAPPVRPEPKVSDLVPRLLERYTRLAGRLENADLDQMPAVRDGIRDVVGHAIPLYPSADRTHLEAHLWLVMAQEMQQVAGMMPAA